MSDIEIFTELVAKAGLDYDREPRPGDRFLVRGGGFITNTETGQLFHQNASGKLAEVSFSRAAVCDYDDDDPDTPEFAGPWTLDGVDRADILRLIEENYCTFRNISDPGLFIEYGLAAPGEDGFEELGLNEYLLTPEDARDLAAALLELAGTMESVNV